MQRHPCCSHLKAYLTENHLCEDEEEEVSDDGGATAAMSYDSIYEGSAESEVTTVDVNPVRILWQNNMKMNTSATTTTTTITTRTAVRLRSVRIAAPSGGDGDDIGGPGRLLSPAISTDQGTVCAKITHYIEKIYFWYCLCIFVGSASEVSIAQTFTGGIAIYGVDFGDCPAVDGERIAMEWASLSSEENRQGTLESNVHLQLKDLHLEDSLQRGSDNETEILEVEEEEEERGESNLTVAAMEKLLHDQSIELSQSRAIISAQTSSIQRLEQELQQLRTHFCASADHPNGPQVADHVIRFQPPSHFHIPTRKLELECFPGQQTEEEVAQLRSELEVALDKVRLLEEQLQERNGLINYAEMVCSQVTRQLSKEDIILNDDEITTSEDEMERSTGGRSIIHTDISGPPYRAGCQTTLPRDCMDAP